MVIWAGVYKVHLYGGAGGNRGCEEVRSCTCAVALGRAIAAAVG
jgi:hypothetical protein